MVWLLHVTLRDTLLVEIPPSIFGLTTNGHRRTLTVSPCQPWHWVRLSSTAGLRGFLEEPASDSLKNRPRHRRSQAAALCEPAGRGCVWPQASWGSDLSPQPTGSCGLRGAACKPRDG